MHQWPIGVCGAPTVRSRPGRGGFEGAHPPEGRKEKLGVDRMDFAVKKTFSPRSGEKFFETSTG